MKLSKILLIGNGSSVLEHEMGNKIDSFQGEVMRFNRFQTKGYEKCVGSKTTVWALHDGHVQHREKYQPGLNIPCVVYIPRFKWLDMFIELRTHYDNLRFFPYQLEQEINEIVNFKEKWPPIGLIALTYAVKNFDEVWHYGFDGFSKKYEFYHYYDKDETRKTEHAWRENRIDHDLNIEERYLKHILTHDKIKNILFEK